MLIFREKFRNFSCRGPTSS